MKNAKKEYLKYAGNLFKYDDVIALIHKWKLKEKDVNSYIGVATEITYFPEVNETRVYTHWDSFLYTEIPSESLTNRLFIRPGLMATKRAIEKLDNSIVFSLEKESIESRITILVKIIFPIVIILISMLLITSLII